MTGTDRTEFVVVGGGLLGLATACALRRRGRDVVLFEQATIGHVRGGSHGAARIFRFGYPDVRYVRMAVAAQAWWRDLEAECGEALLVETGQVSFGHDLQPMVDAMTAAGVAPVALSSSEMRERFPALAVDAPAVYEPSSGVLVADRCLAALRAGADLDVRDRERVIRLDDDPGANSVTVVTERQALHADAVVVTAGPWSLSLVPWLANLGLFTTLEHVAYVRARDEAAAGTPVFIAHDLPAVYGLPCPTQGCYKVGIHHAGSRIDPDRSSRDVDMHAIDAVEGAVRRFLPGFEPAAEFVETCLYDNTPDEHFVVDRRGRVVVGAGTSGHGFKFGPLLGELLADLATGVAPSMPLDMFSVDRSAAAR
jgi:sarcosine oxidase